jgi:hypothetical protein
VLHQPLRLGGLALTCALATAAVALVTLLASNLLLSVVAAVGPGQSVVGASPTSGEGTDDAVQGVLVAAAAKERGCREARLGDRDGRPDRRERCAGQRVGKGGARP